MHLIVGERRGGYLSVSRALAQLDFRGAVRVVGSVSAARDYLEGSGSFHDKTYFPCPDLIVSDMNMPGPTGNAFLEWMRKDERFSHIPFIFLSGSFQPPDKERAEQLGVDNFFRKSGDIAEVKQRVASILKYLPPETPGTPSEARD